MTSTSQQDGRTTSQQAVPDDVRTLAKGLDGSNIQQAKAIAVFTDGRIASALSEVNGLLSELREMHRQTVADAASLPTAERAEVKGVVNDAGQKLRDADQEADDLTARQEAGKPVSQEQVDQVAERTRAAAQAANTARQQVPTSHGRDVSTIDRQLATVRGDDAYVTRGEVNDMIGGIVGSVDQFNEGVKELDSFKLIAITAYEWVENNYRTMRSSGLATAITFVATALIIWAFTAFVDIDANFWFIVSIAAIIAGVVGALVWATGSSSGVPNKARRRRINTLIDAHYDDQERKYKEAREASAEHTTQQPAYPGEPVRHHHA